MKVLNIAFYEFFDLADSAVFRDRIKAFCVSQPGLLGTVIVTPEGVNGSLAGPESSVRAFQNWLRSQEPCLSGVTFKESWSEVNPFLKLFTKLRPKTIPMDEPEVLPHRYTGKRITPLELKSWYETGKDFAVIDSRNDYEFRLGKFRNSIFLGIHHFRKFPQAVKQLPEEIKNKPVVMFCTGGIRCEKATPIAERYGFKEVYQLDGGILQYFKECGSAHWEGACFVFDDRVLIGPDLGLVPSVHCRKCQEPYLAETFEGCFHCDEGISDPLKSLSIPAVC